MWSVLQQRWWHGKLQRNPKVLATAVISLQIDLIFCAPTGINFFPLDIYFFAKLIIYIFFCLVQKSVTVCFQSILLVSKRLLIILLSHSKFFIGHCTHPLFLGTFSFAARSRIYHFFCQMDSKRLPTSYDYNFLYFLLLLHQHSLEKKDVRNPAECLNIG